jgi:hypothetical protein
MPQSDFIKPYFGAPNNGDIFSLVTPKNIADQPFCTQESLHRQHNVLDNELYFV